MAEHLDLGHAPDTLSSLTHAPAKSITGIVPKTIEDVWRLAQLIWQAELAPAGLKNVQAVAIVLMKGLELGLPPMTALSGIGVIGGRPCIYGDLAMALIRRSGLLEDWEETFEGTPYEDDYTAVCMMHRKGAKRPIIRKFSVAQARTAKLWGKKGRDGRDTPWVTNPDRMIAMRARGFAQRDTYQDVLGGIALYEEMADAFGDPADLPALNEPPTAPASNIARLSERREMPMRTTIDARPEPEPVSRETAGIEDEPPGAPQEPQGGPGALPGIKKPTQAEKDEAEARKREETASSKWTAVVKAFGTKIEKMTDPEALRVLREQTAYLEGMPEETVIEINRLYSVRVDFLRKQVDIEDVAKVTYWYHPESGAIFKKQPGEPRPDDPLVEEIDEADYNRFAAEFEGKRTEEPTQTGLTAGETAGALANAGSESAAGPWIDGRRQIQDDPPKWEFENEEAEHRALNAELTYLRSQKTVEHIDDALKGRVGTFIAEHVLNPASVDAINHVAKTRKRLIQKTAEAP